MKEVAVTWQGRDYKFTPTMRFMRQLEDIITIGELAQMKERGAKPVHLAEAIGFVLRHVGKQVTDEEAWRGLFEGDPAQMQQRAGEVVLFLLGLMIPPEHMRAEPGKTEGGAAATTSASAPSTTSSS